MKGKSNGIRHARSKTAWLTSILLVMLASAALGEPYWVPTMKALNSSFSGNEFYIGKAGDSYPASANFWNVFVGSSYDLDDKVDERVVDTMLTPPYPYLPDYSSPATFVGASSISLMAGDPSPLEEYLSGQPEVTILIIGSSDIGFGSSSNIPIFFYTNLMEIVDICLSSNSIPILTTLPPQLDRVGLVLQANDVISMVASNKSVPINDYYTEVITRQPTNWYGTLIAADGIHPSSTGPGGVGVFTDENLNTNGYALLNYTTLRTYQDVLDLVLIAASNTPVFTSFVPTIQTNITGGGETGPPEITTNIYIQVDMSISNLTPFARYNLYRSTNLLEGSFGWNDLGIVASSGDTANKTDTTSNEWEQVFYKVE